MILELSREQEGERDYIIDRALSVRTLTEIQTAAQALLQWIQTHPDDWSAEDALEPLAMLRRGLEAELKIVAAGAASCIVTFHE